MTRTELGMQFTRVRRGGMRARGSGKVAGWQWSWFLAVLLTLGVGTGRIRWEKEGGEGEPTGWEIWLVTSAVQLLAVRWQKVLPLLQDCVLGDWCNGMGGAE